MKIRDLIDYLSKLNGDAEISPEFDLQKWFPKPYPDKEQLHVYLKGKVAESGFADVFDPDDEVSEYIKNKGEWYATRYGEYIGPARAKVFMELHEGGYLVYSHKDRYSATAKFKFRPSDYYQFIGKYAVEPLDDKDFK